MILVLLQFLISALIIVLAGYFLTKYADRIAELTGWGRMFVGGLLLAGATSLPELTVDLKAVQMDLPDLAVGDLLGSSLFNLLILASLDFAFPSAFRRTAFSSQYIHHSLAAVTSILLTAIVGIGIVSQLDISIFGVSIFSWSVVGAYLFGLRLIFKEGQQNQAPQYVATEFLGIFNKRPFIIAVIGYISSTLVIILTAPYLIHAADELAKLSGLGHTFIGTTLVALTTSLPELVATVAAFRMGSPDLAIGNIFGSNSFNMILFFPLDLLYPHVLFTKVRTLHAITALGVVAATSIAVMGQLYRKKERSRFSEPSSEMVVVVILVFLYLLFFLNKLST